MGKASLGSPARSRRDAGRSKIDGEMIMSAVRCRRGVCGTRYRCLSCPLHCSASLLPSLPSASLPARETDRVPTDVSDVDVDVDSQKAALPVPALDPRRALRRATQGKNGTPSLSSKSMSLRLHGQAKWNCSRLAWAWFPTCTWYRSMLIPSVFRYQ